MEETEVKFKVKNFRDVIPKIKKLGASLEWKGIEENYFFDTPTNKLKKKRQRLRLRKWEKHSNSLTLKIKPIKMTRGYKVRSEFQIIVDDLKIARDILKNLGFVEYFQYKKHRQHWKLKDAIIELDKIRDSHYFVEIEAKKSKINQLAMLLNLDWKQSTSKGYLAILKKLNHKAGVGF